MSRAIVLGKIRPQTAPDLHMAGSRTVRCLNIGRRPQQRSCRFWCTGRTRTELLLYDTGSWWEYFS